LFGASNPELMFSVPELLLVRFRILSEPAGTVDMASAIRSTSAL
jgi:hypothetical protein